MRPELPLFGWTPDVDAFRLHFGTDAQCRAHVFLCRFRGRLVCPRCHGTAFRLTAHGAHCLTSGCSYTVSLTRGTIFERTRHTFLRWFKAAFYLRTIPRLSARRLATLVNVTYKCAYAWAAKIRVVLGTLLGPTRLRPLPRPVWPGSRLQGQDLRPTAADPEPSRTARRALAQRYSGHLSDKHLPRYLDEFAFDSALGRRLDALAVLLEALPAALPITYRSIVGPRPFRSRLELRLDAARWRRAFLGF